MHLEHITCANNILFGYYMSAHCAARQSVCRVCNTIPRHQFLAAWHPPAVAVTVATTDSCRTAVQQKQRQSNHAPLFIP